MLWNCFNRYWHPWYLMTASSHDNWSDMWTYDLRTSNAFVRCVDEGVEWICAHVQSNKSNKPYAQTSKGNWNLVPSKKLWTKFLCVYPQLFALASSLENASLPKNVIRMNTIWHFNCFDLNFVMTPKFWNHTSCNYCYNFHLQRISALPRGLMLIKAKSLSVYIATKCVPPLFKNFDTLQT